MRETPIVNEADYFADPNKLTKIDIPEINGWIEVRDEISIGEERAVFAKAVKGTSQKDDGTTLMEYDADKVSFGTTALHIVDWSLKRDYSPAALRALKPKQYNAIDKAVQAHINRTTEGNATALPSSSASPTSESAS